jgi:hypothetical protein
MEGSMWPIEMFSPLMTLQVSAHTRPPKISASFSVSILAAMPRTNDNFLG